MSIKFNSVDEFLQYNKTKSESKIKIYVGMGSCGIAAGADKVLNTFKKEIISRGLNNVELKQVGCLGLCYSEPNVEVIVPDLPNVLYGKVDEKFVLRIIEQHIGNKIIINDNIYDKPLVDVLKL